ncbi:MAG: CoA transferase [Candidatus Tectimicrobiota bacterium]|nr:MAG: CoA transferase [Candidatus Tectomicrobia bacterium]
MAGVLSGIRVVDFTWVWAGPIIGRYLADYGAEVIKVESATRLDLARQLIYKDGVADPDMAVAYTNFNAGKKSLLLNMATSEGIELAKRLIAVSDVVLESMTPKVMRQWGLTYEALRRLKPDLIMLSSCMQGQTGPYCLSPGNGGILPALSGISELTGWPDRGPTGQGGPYTDFLAGAMGAAAVLVALVHRQRTGEGQYIDLSQNESAMHFITTAFLDYSANGRVATRMGNRRPGFAPHGVYRCQGEEAWCTIAVRSEAEWQALCAAMGHPAWTREARFATRAAREANQDALDALITAWTAQLPASEVMARLQRAGVPAAVVHDAASLAHDPQLAHRGHYARLPHPRLGEHVIDNYGFRLSATPGGVQGPAPLLGQHTEEILGGLLGLSSQEIARLRAAGVVA